MKTGIIFIFHNNEGDIDSSIFIDQIQGTKNLEMCLVNNDSIDNTFGILKEIKEECKNVSLVNIRRFKSDLSAVRAGARFMFNQHDLGHIGFVSANEINGKYYKINDLLKLICEKLEEIKKYNNTVLSRQEMKQTLFQSLFSITQYLKEIKVENQLVSLK